MENQSDANDCVGLQDTSYLRGKKQDYSTAASHSLIDWIILDYGEERDKGATSYRFLYI